MIDIKKLKKQFPIFTHHPNLVYLDNASTTQTPLIVLEAMNEYYEKHRANIHRGVYKLSGQATEMYEGARMTVADFLGASSEEIVFTSGATHGLNLLAYSLGKNLKKGDNIVLTRLEHHANLVPWQEMARRFGFEIRWIEISDLIIDENTKIVSVTHVSNALGTVVPIEKIIAAAKKVDAITIIDAAQSVPHMPIDVKNLDCDALVFSGHKVYGPTGIGVLYAKKKLLEKMDPFFFGGDMINEVSYETATWADVPSKFEAGTPNIAGAIGLAAALKFIHKIGYDAIQAHDMELTRYAIEKLQKVEGLSIIGSQSFCDRVGVISFTLDNIHPHDIASILDSHSNVAVRAGHHCTMPLMKLLGLNGTSRASFGIYNTTEDLDALLKGLAEVKKIFCSS